MKITTSHSVVNKLLLLFGVSILYFLSARLGLLLAYENTNASPVWPPSGLALALILIFGKRIWPGIFIGALTANLTVFLAGNALDTPTIIFTSVSIAAGNTLEALAGIYLMQRFINTRIILEKYQNIFKFIAIDLAISMISSTIGSTSLCASSMAPWSIYGTIWYTWLLGDFSGILIITPLLLVWNSNRIIKWKFEGLIEPILITLFIVFFAETIFIQRYSIGNISPRLYVLVPFLLWMVFRFGHKEIITVLTVVSAFAVWGTVNGHGPFASTSLNDSLIQLISFISIITITFMALSATLGESKQALHALINHKIELENKIIERTQMLEQSNLSLSNEIIEKENAKTILQNKTNNLNDAQRIAHIGSWEWDIKTGKEVWSDEQFKMFGYEPAEETASYSLFINSLHPEDKDSVLLAAKQAMDGTKKFNLEYRIIRKEGMIRVIEARGDVSYDEEGIPDRMIGTVMDITERKKAEEELFQYKKFFDLSLDMVCIANSDCYFKKLSPSFTKILGYTEEELLTKKFFEFIYPDDFAVTVQEIEKLEKGELTIGFVCRFICKDGSKKFLQWVAAKDLITGNLFAIARDITDQIKVEEDLRMAMHLAEESSKIKEAFLANMSHEIRTPMNSIVGFSSILKVTELNKKQTELVSNINTASENLLSIINDILDYSKIEAGMLQIENTVIHLPTLLETVYSIAIGNAFKKKLEISLSISPTLPEYIVCDPMRLSQILLNLIANAIKFTEKGFVNIRAEVTRENAQIFNIKFKVNDSGIGIAEENLETIFERFKQESLDTNRKYGGTGLGLSIVKNIVKLLGGEVYVESKLGRGSEFILIIPYSKCTDQQIAEYKNHQHKTEGSDTYKPGRLNILLAEDNRMNQQYCRLLLRQLGFTCTIVNNGKEALLKLNEEKYDLILMDLQMPEMDGYEATRIIRNELNNDTPIIAVTANATVGEQKKCFHIGMNGYVSKPFKPKDLYNNIVSVFRKNLNKQENKNIIAVTGKNGVTENLIDIYFLKEQVNGKMHAVKELIEIFIEDTPRDIEALGDAISKKDYILIEKISHQLVSSFSIIGITSAVQILKAIEYNASNQKELAVLKDLFSQLIEITAKVKTQIDELISV